MPAGSVVGAIEGNSVARKEIAGKEIACKEKALLTSVNRAYPCYKKNIQSHFKK
jgi:hypothetical protein